MLLEADGLRLRLLHGDTTSKEATKKDEGHLDWAERLPARDFAGGRFSWQPYGAQTAGAALVIITQENRFLYHLWALSAGRWLGRPRRLAFWGHGANLQTASPNSARERFKRYWTRRADWWFAYTALSVELVRSTGYPAQRITNVENAIDTRALLRDLASITAAELAAARRRLDLDGMRVGLFMGSLYGPKRLPFLLEAAERIVRRQPGFRLLLSGDGPQRPYVEEAARARPWLRVLGMQKGRDKALALRLAELILNPGMVGLGILDGFAAGVPLLTTDCRIHSPEIAYLHSGVDGLMTPDSVEAYAAAAERLLTDEAERSRLAGNAHTAGARYTIENMAQNFRVGIRAALELPDRR